MCVCVYRCSATSGSHSKGFSSLPKRVHAHTYRSTSDGEIKSSAHGCPERTFMNTYVPTQLIRTQGCLHGGSFFVAVPCARAGTRRSFKPQKKRLVSWHFSRRAPRETCLAGEMIATPEIASEFLLLIILCHCLNCLLKSNYQEVCVAYKIGAAKRGGEHWEG